MLTVFKNLFNTIENSKFLSAVVATIVVALSFALLVYIIRLLKNIRSYVENKANSLIIENRKNTNLDNATIPMTDRIAITNDILDIISTMINDEIISIFREVIALNNPYNLINLDKDAKDISQKVFNGIKPTIFKDPNLILTDEYLISFITKKTIGTLIEVAQTHNNNLRGANQSIGD